MFNLSKKASTFVYLLLLINIAMIMWVIVFNNWFVLNNNINIWKNAEEVFSSVHNKWNIALESVRKYNWNGHWFVDVISCPINVTMSGSTFLWTSITTNMVIQDWSIYCSWDYNWNEFRIYYNSNYSDFIKVYYNWGSGVDIVDLDSPLIQNTWNLLEEGWVTVEESDGWDWASAMDGDPTTEYVSIQGGDKYDSIKFKLSDSYKIWKIAILKNEGTANSRNNWYITFFDSNNIEIDDTILTLTGMKAVTWWEQDFWTSSLYRDVLYIEIGSTTPNASLELLEVYIYQQLITGSWWLWDIIDTPEDFLWTWKRDYIDTDSTFVSFDATWVWWGDDIDDNFNSDDYHVMSDIRDDEYYFWSFQDDDVIPRKTIFWSIPGWEAFDNIYWTNYKTIDFIDKNTNNNDSLNIKAWDVTSWYMYLDISFESSELNKSYDLKILEFDRNRWKNEFTLYPLSTLAWLDVENKFWYISQTSTWALYLSPNTWSWFSFDFQNRDYALFLTNYANTSLSYRLTAETDTWTGIYINSIDDSGTWIIEVLANDIIIGWEKNFIWEEFIIVWNK